MFITRKGVTLAPLKDQSVAVGPLRAAGPYRCDLLLERCLKVVQSPGWRLAGELSEFVNHMHLVEVTEAMCNLSP